MIILPIAIPWFMAVLTMFLDGRRKWVSGIAAAAIGASLVATLGLARQVFAGSPVQMVAGGWAAGVGIALRADALGILFMILGNSLLFIALIYEILGGIEERPFPALLLFLATGLNGLFLTGDAFNFYVFFEISMTASFVLATYGKEKREIRDALTFTVVNLLGSTIFLAAIAALYHVTGTLDMRAISVYADQVEPNTIILIATAIFAAFGVKLGLFPFHFWLPSVYQGMRPVVAAILSGVLANIGSYGLLRFGADVLSRELRFAAPVLGTIGVAGVIYGAFLAISRRDEREVLAYSSISQAGYILIGLSIGGLAGYTAAILIAIVNAINKTLLFLSVGLKGRIGGIAFVIGALSVAGIPPAIGFFGKLSIFQAGIAQNSAVLMALLIFGGGLAFLYMFRIYQRSHWARQLAEEAGAKMAGPYTRQALILAFAGVVIFSGLWPEPLLVAVQVAAEYLHGGIP